MRVDDCGLQWVLQEPSQAAIAQLVEHLIRNEGVGGSNPSCGTKNFNDLGRRYRRLGRSHSFPGNIKGNIPPDGRRQVVTSLSYTGSPKGLGQDTPALAA